MKRLMQMFRNRRKLLRFAPVVAALTAFLFLVVNVPFAGADNGKGSPKNYKNAHDYYKIRDPKVDSKLTSAQRSRVQRDSVFKKRQEHKKNIQDIMSGKQPTRSGGGDK